MEKSQEEGLIFWSCFIGIIICFLLGIIFIWVNYPYCFLSPVCFLIGTGFLVKILIDMSKGQEPGLHEILSRMKDESLTPISEMEDIPNVRKKLTAKQRHEIWRRDNFTCQYCGKTIKDLPLEVDHILPVSKGGTNAPSNLQTLCIDCNREKRDK